MTARRRSCSRGSPRRTRSLIDPARRQRVRHAAAAPAPRQRRGRVRSSRSSISRSRAHGAAGVDVQRAVRRGAASGAGGGRGPAGAGRGSARDADACRSRCSSRGDERQVVVTRQVPCSACRGAGRLRDAGGPLRAVRGQRPDALGARAHGVLEGVRGLRRQRPAAVATRARACVGHGRAVRSEAVPVRCRRACATARGCGSPSSGHAGRHGGPTGDLYVTVQVAPHPLFRREGRRPALHAAGGGARGGARRADRRAVARRHDQAERCRRARRAAGASACSGRGFPTAAGGARRSHRRSAASSCRRRIDERSQELMREFGRLNREDVRKDFTHAISVTRTES